MSVKFMNAYDAACLIKDGDSVLTDGFVGACFAEELAAAVERRFLETSAPRDITVVYCAGQGDGKTRGVNHFGYEGLLKRVIGGHWNLVPRVQKLAVENKIEAYNLPQGVMSQMFRDIAAKRPGTLTNVGLKTFVDPRNGGGKLNSRTTEDIVELIEINGKQSLFYKHFPLSFALLRGTYADENGNISMEKEGVICSMLSAAQAVKNSGGTVVVQVEKVVKEGTLDPRMVRIPGIYVDVVVVASEKNNHMQTFATTYDPSFSGEVCVPFDSVKQMDMSERKIICRRAAMEIKEGDVVNLGIGLPEGVGVVANEKGISNQFTLTVESGIIGGIPQGGLDFGCSINPSAIIDQASQFDGYHGGCLDLACLGLAEVDQYGNINVSKFGPRIPGAGGFIDITQNAKKVVFCGTFTAKGLKLEIKNGAIKIVNEGSVKKFVKNVEQITFSGEYAMDTSQEVLYITERAVFKLTPRGMKLVEIAPGIDIQKDILNQMDFVPICEEIKTMDKDIFI